MSVQSEIERISGNVADTYSVLEETGSELPEEQNSDNLSEAVRVALTPVNPDWGQSDYTKKDYIKNRTHYQEKVTISWDGNTDGMEVYEPTNINYNYEGNYRKLIRVLDYIPASLEDITVFGLLKYSQKHPEYAGGSEEYYSSDCFINESDSYEKTEKKVMYQPKIFSDLSSLGNCTAEAVSVFFKDGVTTSRNASIVVFVLSEGTFGGFSSNSSLYFDLPVGVYFSEIKSNSDGCLYKTMEYSFMKTLRVEDYYLSRSLCNYAYSFGKNRVAGSFSMAEGDNNYIGSLSTTNVRLYEVSDEDFYDNVYGVIDISFYSHAEGKDNWVLSAYSHAEGYNNKLRVPKSHIEGSDNVLGNIDQYSVPSSAQGCHVEGVGNVGSAGLALHVEGIYNQGLAEAVHVEGEYNEAKGIAAHAQNTGNKAYGDSSDAGGVGTEANHKGSFTRGLENKSGRNYQAVFGEYNEVYNDSLFDVGNGSSDTDRKTAFSVKEDGSARVQLQGETEDSITRKDYVDNAIKSSVDEAVKKILNIAENVDSWETVQKIVRAGYAPVVFKVGDQFVCNHSEFGELTWDIIGFDHDVPTDSSYEHSMTLQLHDILDNTYREYDGREALFCASEEISPGNYCLSYNSKVDGSGAIYYIKFTIPEGVVVPVGGLFVNLATTGNTYSILQNCFSTDAPLGTFTATTSSSVPDGYTLLGESNYYRANANTSASSFYKESGIRFYLNGNSSGGIDWAPQHSCDMPPSYINSSGFMYGLDEDFKKVLGKVSKKTYDAISDSVICTEDFVFLLSRSEVYGGDNISVSDCVVDEELPYEYYINNSELEECSTSADSNRIKYGSDDVAYKYYLRSLSISSAAACANSNVLFRIGCISASGSVAMITCRATSDSNKAYLVPCCCIV